MFGLQSLQGIPDNIDKKNRTNDGKTEFTWLYTTWISGK